MLRSVSKTCPGYRGFTLFEVAISLLLVSFAVTSVMMIFPIGISQQKSSSNKILAAAKALEMVDAFAGSLDQSRNLDAEVPEPWEGSNYAYTSMRWDMEARLASWHYGILPLPTVIAHRLDSDGEEIARLLDEGAYLYYAQPTANTNLDERWMSFNPINGARSIVFTVVGYAQNNAIPRLPWKAWPYRAPYPSPPISSFLDNTTLQGAQTMHMGDAWCWEWWFAGNAGRPDQVIPAQKDPGMERLFLAAVDYGNGPGPATRQTYITRALAYAKNAFTTGVVRFPLPVGAGTALAPADEYQRFVMPVTADDAQLDALGADYDRAFASLCRSTTMVPGESAADTADHGKRRVDVALRVQCLRFLAHAMMTLSSKGQVLDLVSGKAVSTTVLDGITITPRLLRYWHERSLAMVMRYAACCPYDWGAPRPQQRCIMMDQPLLEWDLFSPPRSGAIGGQVPAAMWRPMSAQPVSNLGPPAMYSGSYTASGQYHSDIPPYPNGDVPAPNAFWGDPRHFTLTKPFRAAERCRQLVFWSVDWQSYEDAELVPSAPLDASKHPLLGPTRENFSDWKTRWYTRAPWGSKENYHLLNPEYRLIFTQEVNGLATGTDVSALTAPRTNDEFLSASFRTGANINGIHGADRNGNDRLDRGQMPRTKRLRADFLARFNFYDPRLPVVMR